MSKRKSFHVESFLQLRLSLPVNAHVWVVKVEAAVREKFLRSFPVDMHMNCSFGRFKGIVLGSALITFDLITLHLSCPPAEG